MIPLHQLLNFLESIGKSLFFKFQGDVQKKRAAFENQIRCLSEDSKSKVMNGKVRTPSSGAVRKIVSEERAVNSPMGASGLARSPAMHSGY